MDGLSRGWLRGGTPVAVGLAKTSAKRWSLVFVSGG